MPTGRYGCGHPGDADKDGEYLGDLCDYCIEKMKQIEEEKRIDEARALKYQ